MILRTVGIAMLVSFLAATPAWARSFEMQRWMLPDHPLAWSVNVWGEAVGSGRRMLEEGGYPVRAFYHDGRTIRYFGALGPNENSRARAINDFGQIVGNTETAPPRQTRAAYFDTATMTVIDLGTLGGEYSDAWDINNLGVIVGEADDDDGVLRAFIHDEDGMRPLPALVDADPDTSGLIIGNARIGPRQVPFIHCLGTDVLIPFASRVVRGASGRIDELWSIRGDYVSGFVDAFLPDTFIARTVTNACP